MKPNTTLTSGGVCPTCGERFSSGDLIIRLASDRKISEHPAPVRQSAVNLHSSCLPVRQSTVSLHSSCFMDIVNISDVEGGPISRTAIMDGRVRIEEDDDGHYLEVEP